MTILSINLEGSHTPVGSHFNAEKCRHAKLSHEEPADASRLVVLRLCE